MKAIVILSTALVFGCVSSHFEKDGDLVKARNRASGDGQAVMYTCAGTMTSHFDYEGRVRVACAEDAIVMVSQGGVISEKGSETAQAGVDVFGGIVQLLLRLVGL